MRSIFTDAEFSSTIRRVSVSLKEDIRDIYYLCKLFKNSNLNARYKSAMMQHTTTFLSSCQIVFSENRESPSHAGPRCNLANVHLSGCSKEGHRDDAQLASGGLPVSPAGEVLPG